MLMKHMSDDAPLSALGGELFKRRTEIEYDNGNLSYRRSEMIKGNFSCFSTVSR